MSTPTQWDRDAVRSMLKAHGAVGLLDIVINAMSEVGDPEAPEGTEPVVCYAVAHALNDMLEDFESV